jgi:hypothetical protein
MSHLMTQLKEKLALALVRYPRTGIIQLTGIFLT